MLQYSPVHQDAVFVAHVDDFMWNPHVAWQFVLALFTFAYFTAVEIRYVVISRCLSWQCEALRLPSFFSFHLCFLFALSCCAGLCSQTLCWVLCRDACPAGLIKADTETSCITALMKSVSPDCTQGRLTVQQHYLPLHRRRGEREWDEEVRVQWGVCVCVYVGEVVRWDTEIGGDLAKSLGVRLCACVPVWVIMHWWIKRCAMLACLTSVGSDQRSRQPQSPC